MTAPQVILVEDEPLVAMLMEDLLVELGCRVDAFGALAPAMSWLAAQSAPPAGAVLDVNLGGGETIFPLAHELQIRGVPFVFVTGYGVLPVDEFPGAVVLRKPVDVGTLKTVVKTFASRPAARSEDDVAFDSDVRSAGLCARRSRLPDSAV